MALIVVDSDVLIDALRGREPAVRRVTDGLHAGVLCTTTVTVFELLSGVRTEGESAAVERLLAAMSVLPFDEAAALIWARLMADGRVKGKPRSALDTIIVAVAEANGCVVVTDNEKDFAGVQILNPLKPA